MVSTEELAHDVGPSDVCPRDFGTVFSRIRRGGGQDLGSSAQCAAKPPVRRGRDVSRRRAAAATGRVPARQASAHRRGAKSPRHSRARQSGWLEHDPEKWKPVFRKDHAPSKNWTMIRFNLIGSWSACTQSSATKPEAFTTGPQRAISDLTVSVNSAGVWNAGSLPNLARLSTMALDWDTWPIAALTSATMSFGVFAGRKTPDNDSTTTLYPDSLKVG